VVSEQFGQHVLRCPSELQASNAAISQSRRGEVLVSTGYLILSSEAAARHPEGERNRLLYQVPIAERYAAADAPRTTSSPWYQPASARNGNAAYRQAAAQLADEQRSKHGSTARESSLLDEFGVLIYYNSSSS
jgi:hypothetical protein